MNENCMHSSLGAFIETLRKMRKITIAELALEAHISTKTYIHIKKLSTTSSRSSKRIRRVCAAAFTRNGPF